MTVTHHDFELEYDLEALKANIAHCDKQIAVLQQEIDNQRAHQEELARLIQQQEARNKEKTVAK